MTHEHFTEAIDIISRHTSTTIHVNGTLKHLIGNLGSTEFLIQITQCAPPLVNDLVKNGYSLSMTSEGLRVDKIR